MRFRFASTADIPALAAMNRQLILDEGHRETLSDSELAQRLTRFLSEGCHAVLFEAPEGVAGYALYRLEPDHAHLRQFFVAHDHRRRGVGRAAFAWLRDNPWRERPRIRLDVLAGNQRGIRFWRSVGFRDYCLVMEADPADLQAAPGGS